MTDSPDKINSEKESRILKLLFYLGQEIANAPKRPAVESGELQGDRGGRGMSGTLADFDTFRARMNELILGAGNLTINRFFSLDRTTYEPGALGTKTKEMLGLVSSLVLRCDDCVTYHVVRCHEEGVTREEFLEIFSVGLVVGGSIVIPHLRRAMARWRSSPHEQDPGEDEPGADRLERAGRSPRITAAPATATSGVMHMKMTVRLGPTAARSDSRSRRRPRATTASRRPARPTRRARLPPPHAQKSGIAGDQQARRAGDGRHGGDAEGLSPAGSVRSPSVYPAQQNTAQQRHEIAGQLSLTVAASRGPGSRAPRRVATRMPPMTRGRAGSSPNAAARSATSDGIEARMSALLEALVRASPEMKPSW